MWNKELKNALTQNEPNHQAVLDSIKSSNDMNATEQLRDGITFTPVSWAIDQGHYDLAEAMIKLPHFSVEDGNVLTLVQAIRARQESLALLLLSKLVPGSVLIEDYIFESETALYSATQQGMDKVISALLDHGADPLYEPIIDSKPHTSAFGALVMQNNLELIKKIVGHPKFQCTTALRKWIDFAKSKDWTEMANLLDKVHQDSTESIQAWALFNAIQMQNKQEVMKLIQAGVDVNRSVKICGLSRTPLYAAMLHKNIELVQLLLENNASCHSDEFDHVINHGLIHVTPLSTAVCWAVNNNEDAIFKLLMKSEEVPPLKRLSMPFAYASRNPQYLRVMLEKYAKKVPIALMEIDYASHFGLDEGPCITLLGFAVTVECQEAVELLLEYGANPRDKVSQDSPSALEIAENMYEAEHPMLSLLLNRNQVNNDPVPSVQAEDDDDYLWEIVKPEPQPAAVPIPIARTQDHAPSGWDERLKKTLFNMRLDHGAILELINSGGDVNAIEMFAELLYTPLSWVIHREQYELAKAILNHPGYRFEENSFLALNAAIDSNEVELVNMLLAKGIPAGLDAEKFTRSGKSALFLAIDKNMISVINALLDHGVCPLTKRRLESGVETSPLYYAVHQTKIRSAKAIITHPKFEYPKFENDVLCLAISMGEREITLLLAQAWAAKSMNESLVSLVVKQGATYILRILLDEGLDPNQRIPENPQWTPLLMAIAYRRSEAAMMMLNSPQFVYKPGPSGAALVLAKNLWRESAFKDVIAKLSEMKSNYEDDLYWADPEDDQDTIVPVTPSSSSTSVRLIHSVREKEWIEQRLAQISEEQDKLYGNYGLFKM